MSDIELRADSGYGTDVSLGPLPNSLREQIVEWIDEARGAGGNYDPGTNSLFISGGPSWLEYLDADGQVFAINPTMDAPPFLVKDGPAKVASIVIASRRYPELTAWLPERTGAARDCVACSATGWWCLPGSSYSVICRGCAGLGWLPE
jgi:hypothetical protein